MWKSTTWLSSLLGRQESDASCSRSPFFHISTCCTYSKGSGCKLSHQRWAVFESSHDPLDLSRLNYCITIIKSLVVSQVTINFVIHLQCLEDIYSPERRIHDLFSKHLFWTTETSHNWFGQKNKLWHGGTIKMWCFVVRASTLYSYGCLALRGMWLERNLKCHENRVCSRAISHACPCETLLHRMCGQKLV